MLKEKSLGIKAIFQYLLLCWNNHSKENFTTGPQNKLKYRAVYLVKCIYCKQDKAYIFNYMLWEHIDVLLIASFWSNT